jgi:hypothetical protein
MSQPNSNVFVLSRINKALRADFQHLTEADEELQTMLDDARTYGERIVPAMADDGDWRAAWTRVEELTGDIRLYMTTLRHELEAGSAASLSSFEDVITRDDSLHAALQQAHSRLEDETTSSENREVWEALWQSLHSHLDVIRAYLAGARARIEMRRKHGDPETEVLRQEVLGQLPADASLSDADQFAEQYEDAFQQFQRDKHRTGGLVDVFKALLLIQEEGPEAKIRRKMYQDAEI